MRVNWEDIENYIKEVKQRFNGKITGVYGIQRGGGILATLVAYSLDVPLLLAPCKGCLIIDDIADSGRSLMHYTENDTQFNKYYITTMFYCERSAVKPDYFYRIKTDEWIEYPWEVLK